MSKSNDYNGIMRWTAAKKEWWMSPWSVIEYHICVWRLLLTHWGRVTYICVSKLTIIVSDNGLSPDWRQAIIWTNGEILLIRPLGTSFSEIGIGIYTFSFKKKHLKVSSAKWQPFCLGLNVLKSLTNNGHRSEQEKRKKYMENTFPCVESYLIFYCVKKNIKSVL